MNAADYDRFAVVMFAPGQVREQVAEIRRRVPPSGRPIMDAHVTVKGTFVEPTDLDLIAERVQQCCRAAAPMTLVARGIHFGGDERLAGFAVRVENSEPLEALHWQLVRALKDLGRTTYGGEDIGVFTPHLTLVQDIPTAGVPATLQVIQQLQPGYSFEAAEVALVGRRGGKVWETLAAFRLGNGEPI